VTLRRCSLCGRRLRLYAEGRHCATCSAEIDARPVAVCVAHALSLAPEARVVERLLASGERLHAERAARAITDDDARDEAGDMLEEREPC
jgi:hypothetical protein